MQITTHATRYTRRPTISIYGNPKVRVKRHFDRIFKILLLSPPLRMSAYRDTISLRTHYTQILPQRTRTISHIIMSVVHVYARWTVCETLSRKQKIGNIWQNIHRGKRDPFCLVKFVFVVVIDVSDWGYDPLPIFRYILLFNTSFLEKQKTKGMFLCSAQSNH